MGVLAGSADFGFADSGEWLLVWKGKVAVTGVASCDNFGLVVLAAAMTKGRELSELMTNDPVEEGCV